eukprot:1161993-Pelagomonas_calceolata.AAC.9
MESIGGLAGSRWARTFGEVGGPLSPQLFSLWEHFPGASFHFPLNVNITFYHKKGISLSSKVGPYL